MADLHVLYDTNFRDTPDMLRKIADRIEEGKYGAVGACGIVMLGDKMTVHGCGEDSTPSSIGMLFSAAHLRLAKALEEHGSK